MIVIYAGGLLMIRISTILFWLSQALSAAGPDQSGPTKPDAGWSETVDGMRIRLKSQKSSYRIGEDIHLRLEIHNAGMRPRLFVEPNLMPIISYENSSPYGPDHRFPWVISFETPGREVHILWARRSDVSRVMDTRTLLPGQTFVLEITAKRGPLRDIKDQPRKKGNVQPKTVQFVLANHPGRFRLRATFMNKTRGVPNPDNNFWKARRLDSVPVELEIVR